MISDKQIRSRLLCHVVEPNLSSPSSLRRIFSLQLLVELSKYDKDDDQRRDIVIHSDEKNTKSPYELALLAETTSPTIGESRERERLFELLAKSIDSSHCRQQQEHIVKYLLGSIYVNFEHLWGATIRTISNILSFSKWQWHLVLIVLNNLRQTDSVIYNNVPFTLPPIDKTLIKYIPEKIRSLLDDEDQTFIKDRPDHVLHRHLLYQVLVNHSDVIEKHHNLQERFIDSFLLLVHKHLLVSPFIEKYESQNLLECKVECIEENAKDSSFAPATQDIERTDQQQQVQAKSKFDAGHSSDKRRIRDTFTSAIKTLKEFKNIKKVHREPEINDLLLNLLCSRDNSIQHAAFNCLLSYEHEYIKPYVEKILNIMSDKMVRTEFALFSVESDQDRILHSGNANKVDHIIDCHRPQVMPIIMRVLFGKMLGRIGKRAAGKDRYEQRKALVMRFIAGCKTEEIVFFLSLVLGPTFDHVKLSYPQLEVELSIDKLNLVEYVPLFKLHAIIVSLHAFMDEVAPSKPETLPYLMKTLIVIIMLVNQPLLSHNGKISDEKIVKTLKDLNRRCLLIVNKFFSSFEYYDFEEVEINLIFKYLIWNSARDFSNRNQSRPTPLFQLIEIFSNYERFYPLLVKKDDCFEKTLLDCVIELYKVEKNFAVDRKILKFTASIITNLLKAGKKSAFDNESDINEDEEMFDAREDSQQRSTYLIPVKNMHIVPYDEAEFNLDKPIKVHMGVKILLGHVGTILDRLQNNCKELIEKKKIEFRIELEELEILSIFGALIKNPEQSMICAKLLVLTLQHHRNEELKLETIRAIKCLVRYVESINDPHFIPLIGEVLSSMRNIQQRKEICELLKVIANVRVDIESASSILSLMNATYNENDGSPDLVTINEGFQFTFQYLADLKDTEICTSDVHDSFNLLVNQICYFLNNVDKYEFSVRDNSAIFFEKLSIKLKNTSDAKLFNSLVNDLLLENFIKKGLRDTNEVIKNSYICVLRSFAINCSEHGLPWREFNLFCDSDKDADFWSNIRHIQLHTRSRALAKLLASPELNQVSPKTLSTYFLPIASGFLFSKTYKSVASLSLNSIRLISKICKRLNWSTYESILTYYLSMLTKANSAYQSTNIKLITEIIKSFSFDLSACQEAAEKAEENSKLEKRMRKRRHESVNIIHTEAPMGKKLNQSTARLVYYSITKKILPRLGNCFHEATHVEFEHDKNMSDYKPEKEEIKRIPLAYAIVQLLNILPNRYLLYRGNLPGLFLKLCSFLKSKSELVRKAARVTLVKIMKFVGPAYMPDLLRELKQSLDKGFQIHVLNYTIHSVLNKLPLTYGDLDHSAQELINSCAQEIFGRVSDDKEIAQILAKTYEAKKTKSYDTLLILSTHIGADKLDLLMENFIHQKLMTATDPKTLNKLSLCVQKVYTGLSKNNKFPVDRLLTFIETNIRISIPSLAMRQKIELASYIPDTSNKRLRPDRFLIEKDLPRDRVKSRINEKGNFHMIVENSLRLLFHTFQQNKALIDRKPALKLQLDGFVDLLSSCLKSSSPRCVSRALKCIHFIANTKSDLPSFEKKNVSLVKRIFILLNLYNGVGMAKGDNYEMIMMCFKTLTLLLTNCKDVKLNDNQLQALLSYIEQDIYDDGRQATAFKALHSILKRKLNAPELADIMRKLADLIVTSQDDTVRRMSVLNWSTYLLDYAHTSQAFQSYLKLFMRQIDYEFIDGRKSLLDLFDIIINKFPENIINDHQELLFHLLAQRLVNEESTDLQSLVTNLLTKLIQRLPNAAAKNFIFNKAIMRWATNELPSLKLLAIKLMIIYMNVSKNLLDRQKIAKALEKISECLNVTPLVTTQENGDDADHTNEDDYDAEDDEHEDERAPKCKIRLVTIIDELNIQTLTLFKFMLEKGLVECTDSRHIDSLKLIWQNISSQKLTYWHLPVVLLSCDLYTIFLKDTNLGTALNAKDPSPDDYINWNAKRIVRVLCDKFIELLDRAVESSELQTHITRSLILLGQFIAQSNLTIELETAYKQKIREISPDSGSVLDHMLKMDKLPSEGIDSDNFPAPPKKRIDLVWLATKIVMQARKEAAVERLKNFHRRIFVLRWTAAMSEHLGTKRLPIYAILFLMTPARELSDRSKIGKLSSDSPQKVMLTMAEDFLKFVKNVLGVEKFNKLYANVQLFYTKKRVERRKNVAIAKVKDQARGVKRKLKQSSKKTKTRSNAQKEKRRKSMNSAR